MANKKKTKEASDIDATTTDTVVETAETVEAPAVSAPVVPDVSKVLKSITKSLNKEFGEDTVKVMSENYDNIKDYVKTGVHVIDYIIGGKGFPVGRISEIYGQPSAGKTSIAMHLLKTTINRGGIAVMLDSEAAFSFDMARKIGMDVDKLVYMNPTSLEDIWRKAEYIINTIKQNSPNILCTIVIDSIAQAPSLNEREKDINTHEMGERARINSKAIRKITMDISDNNICFILLNQVREAIGVQYGDTDTIPGGKAIDFATTIKLRVNKNKPIVSEDDKNGPAIGQIAKLRVMKNKIGNPFMEADIEMFFSSGISEYSGLFEKMKAHGVIYKNGSYYAFNGPNGQESFYAKDFETFMKDHDYLLDFNSWGKYLPPKEDE